MQRSHDGRLYTLATRLGLLFGPVVLDTNIRLDPGTGFEVTFGPTLLFAI